MKITIKPMTKTILLACLLYFVITIGAHASGQSGGDPKFEPDKVALFAKKVEKELAAKGVRVFIISRVGRPTSDLPSGIHYTHTAFAVYSSIETSDNRKVPGYAIYNLYQLDESPEKSQLVVDYPVDFFIGAHELRAGIIIPKPELQKRLLELIGSDTYKSLHNPNYSALANPFNLKYQNCTEHTLDVINAAIYNTSDRRQLKVNAKQYFDAIEVDVNPMKLMMGTLFMPDIAVDDHDEVIETSTFTTIAKYLESNNLVQEQFVITAN